MAFEWLEKAFEQRSVKMTGIRVDPGFDNLRDDHRFSILLEKVGFK
jgi:hypothetical protein